jgi:hypothetical protein
MTDPEQTAVVIIRRGSVHSLISGGPDWGLDPNDPDAEEAPLTPWAQGLKDRVSDYVRWRISTRSMLRQVRPKLLILSGGVSLALLVAESPLKPVLFLALTGTLGVGLLAAGLAKAWEKVLIRRICQYPGVTVKREDTAQVE